MADLEELRDLLVSEGQAWLARPLEPVAFTGDPAGDELLNDLVHYPHAFLFGCLVDGPILRAGSPKFLALLAGLCWRKTRPAAALALRRHGDRSASRYAAPRQPLPVRRLHDLERYTVERDLSGSWKKGLRQRWSSTRRAISIPTTPASST